MNHDKLFFRHVLLHYFNLKKTAAEMHRLLSEVYETPSKRTCRIWFECFQTVIFRNVKDKERPLLCIWWNQGDVLYEFLRSNKTVTADRY